MQGTDPADRVRELEAEVERLKEKLVRAEAAELAHSDLLAQTENLLDLVPGGLVQVGPTGAILRANAQACRFLGLSYDALQARYVQDFDGNTFLADGSPCPVDGYPVAQCLASGEPAGPTLIGVQQPDDSVHWAVFRAFPVALSDGSGVSAVVSFVDVTEFRNTEEALRRRSTLLLSAVTQVPVGVIVGSAPDGRVLHANDFALRMRGRMPKDLRDSAAMHANQWRFARRDGTPFPVEELPLLRAVLHGETVRDVDLVVTQEDGEERLVLAQASPVRDERGDTIGGVVVFVDVTERLRAAEARKALEAQMLRTQKLESLGVLAGGIAHDFNNLLTSILGNAELAERRLQRHGDASGALHAIRAAAERAAGLTRQMLAYSGRGSLEVRSLDVVGHVMEIVDLAAASIPKKVRLEVERRTALPAVEADPSHLQQLVMNLVINGAEAVGDAPGRVRVELREARLDDQDLRMMAFSAGATPGRFAQLRIQDTGCGMSAETVAQIFDPFYTTKDTGRGLGLAAVLGIVRSHGAALHVESVVGEGTTFDVYLPVSDQPADRTESKPPPAGEGLVLVVDDEPVVREVAGQLLELLGYQTVLANGGRAAVELFRSRHREIDAVLLDLTMPELSGAETLGLLREIDPGARVVMMSGYPEPEVVTRAQASGPVGFLQKPFRPEALGQALGRILNKA